MNREVLSFIEAGSAEQQALYARLHGLITGLYPEAQITLWYKVPTYRAKSGWVCLNYWKGGVSLLTNKPALIEAFKAGHPTFKTNKASINFRLGDTIPVDDVEDVITRAMTGE